MGDFIEGDPRDIRSMRNQLQVSFHFILMVELKYLVFWVSHRTWCIGSGWQNELGVNDQLYVLVLLPSSGADKLFIVML